jgi:hypothetical protein
MLLYDHAIYTLLLPATLLLAYLPAKPFFSSSRVVFLYKERNIKQSTNVQEIAKEGTVMAYLLKYIKCVNHLRETTLPVLAKDLPFMTGLHGVSSTNL